MEKGEGKGAGKGGKKIRNEMGKYKATHEGAPRGFNGSVNTPESCDFQKQFDPLNIICCRHTHFE